MDLEADDEAMIGSKKLSARYGNKCTLTLYRWMRDPKLNFPKPVKINNRYFWTLGQLRRWERERAVGASWAPTVRRCTSETTAPK
jgi:predicted DNA-binding transcriptional regulator AlpA